MKNDRRSFLKNVGGAGAAAAAVTALNKQAQAQEVIIIGPELPPKQEFSLARQGEEIKFALQLDGSFAGWLMSAEGGSAYAEVVTEKFGPDGVARKHLAGVKYEDITVTCGSEMSKAFYQWIKDSFDKKYSRKNGAIVTADFKYESLTTLNFTNALISEISLPALDAASKDAAKMTLKFSPEVTRTHKASGKLPGTPVSRQQKQWLPSNFRLRIDGLEEACQKVSKIEALTVKQKITENPVGEERDYELEPSSVEFPDLKVSLSVADGKQFFDWHEDFVIKGKNGTDAEKTGTLEYLTPDLGSTLFTIKFKNLGIFKCAPEKSDEHKASDASAGKKSDYSYLRRIKAEMYCEELTFDYGQVKG